jgi:small subunit ribosomal protein S4
MSRFTGPRLKVMRALGTQLPGLSRKSMERKPYPPGHAAALKNRRPSKKSTYGLQLQEKQKLRYNYGLTENQMRRLVANAFRKKGQPGENILAALEARLDNAVFRAGFAPTIPAARQMVLHGHIRLNGKKVNIRSIKVTEGDTLAVTEKYSATAHFKSSWEKPSLITPQWIDRTISSNTAKIISKPNHESVPFSIDTSAVVEFYSRVL